MTEALLSFTSLGALACSVLAVTSVSPVAMVVWLVGVFALAAWHLALLGLSFLGLSYLVVYVGAVAVLFLFVVMMMRLGELNTVGRAYTQSLPLAFLLGVGFLAEYSYTVPSLSSLAGSLPLGIFHSINGVFLGLGSQQASMLGVGLSFTGNSEAMVLGGVDQVQALGAHLYGHGAIFLLVTSLILLLAMLGPITLCHRPRA